MIPRDESVVVSITGNGYKTSDVMADQVTQPMYLGRSLREFEAFLLEEHQAREAKLGVRG